VIFIITFVLNEVKISMGAAFGLFAVFSMLRYRTSSITMKDMTARGTPTASRVKLYP